MLTTGNHEIRRAAGLTGPGEAEATRNPTRHLCSTQRTFLTGLDPSTENCCAAASFHGVYVRVYMTLRYAHVADKDVEAAAERVGQAIVGLLKT